MNVPPRLSPGGRRERRFFDTLGAATAFVEELRAGRDNIAVVNRALSPTELLDAASAFDLLAESSQTATLTEAVRVYLEVWQRVPRPSRSGNFLSTSRVPGNIAANSICGTSSGPPIGSPHYTAAWFQILPARTWQLYSALFRIRAATTCCLRSS